MDEILIQVNAVLRLLVLGLALVGGAGNLAAGVWLIGRKGDLRRGVAHLVIAVITALVLVTVIL